MRFLIQNLFCSCLCAAALSSSCWATVTVKILPGDTTVAASAMNGAVQNFTATASDGSTLVIISWMGPAGSNSAYGYGDAMIGVPIGTPGIYTIDAAGGSAATASVTLTVVSIGAVTFDAPAIRADGTSATLAGATITPAGRTIVWTIQGPDLGCTVDSNGLVTAGTTGGIITVRAADSQLANCYSEATLKVVEVSFLDVTGATEVSEDLYATPIAGSGDAILTAVTNPDISGIISSLPSGFVTWNGGVEGDDQLHRKVTTTTAAQTDVTATCGASIGAATIYVVEVSLLNVTGAIEFSEDEYATPIAASGDVIVEAATNPDISSFASTLPSGFITWNGGADGEDQLHRNVTMTAAAQTDVTATCGTSSAIAIIYVVEVLNLDVTGATAVSDTEYATPIAVSGDVVLTASTDPDISGFVSSLPGTFISWNGGVAGDDQLHRKVTTTVAAKTDVMATCGSSNATATIYVVSVTNLEVPGTAQISENEYATPIAASGDVIVTAVTIPDISGIVSTLPSGFITWNGGAAGADQLHQKVTKTVAAQTDVTATCGTSSATATVYVVAVSLLNVTGARAISNNVYAAPIAASGDVIVTADTTPDISSFASSLPSGFITWSGGVDGDDQLHRNVALTVAASTVVTATCGTSSATATIYVVQLVSATTEHAPDKTADSRTTIGVCETTTISTVPALLVNWSVSGEGAVTPTGTTTTFQAADVFDTSSVNASIGGVSLGLIQYTVIEPEGNVLSNPPVPQVYEPKKAGSGFRAKVTIQPTFVCFSGIKTQEQVAIGAATGYYDVTLGWNGMQHPQTTFWIPIDNLNHWAGFVDKVGTLAPAGSRKPFSAGTFIWNIPQRYRSAVAGRSHYYATIRHEQDMVSGPSGKETTSKGGASHTRTPVP